MKSATVRSNWLPKGGFRLDCSPYLGGAIETEILLEALPVRKDSLGSVTKEIFNGPQFVRNYVDDPEIGVPFMTGSSMLLADLSDLPLLSKRDALSSKLKHLQLKHGMSLISCSGTIGKMAYARPEMEGIWGSQDILKVVPIEDLIPSGYLYAFLSSKFGVPLITSGTYGAIIQHLEPHHISGLSVPRFGDALEHEIHELVEEAAKLRSEASGLFHDAIAQYHETCDLVKSLADLSKHASCFTTVSSNKLYGRLDTNFHQPRHYSALNPFLSGRVSSVCVHDLAQSIVEPARFKRIEINDESAVNFFGTGTLGDVDPEPMYRIAGGTWIEPYRVNPETILIPRSGQIYGIIGTAYQPIGKVLNSAVTEDAIRLHCASAETAGFLFLALRSPFGLKQLKARCFGGSIPHLDVANIGKVMVPKVSDSEMHDLGSMALSIGAMRTSAIRAETDARSLIETAILNR